MSGHSVSAWREAEEAAASHMRKMGYAGVKLTTGGADGGVDVRASGAIAQVKFESKPGGRPAVQRVVGARRGDTSAELLFFSMSGFSAHAVDYAKTRGAGLYEMRPDGSVRAANPHATQRGLGAKKKNAGWLAIGGAALAWKGLTMPWPPEVSGPGGVFAGIAVVVVGVAFARYGWRGWTGSSQ